jgi:hypothetical protein
MISMKVVNKWNRRLLRSVRRTGQSGNKDADGSDADADVRSMGSNDDDVRITDGSTGVVTKTVARRTRDSVMQTVPSPGHLSQQSSKHLDFLYAHHHEEESMIDTTEDVPEHGIHSGTTPFAVRTRGGTNIRNSWHCWIQQTTQTTMEMPAM